MMRAEQVDRLGAGEVFDVLIIGGGAAGLGAAVDAAARGHKVALVERADFASGTSSRSTKLVHGGVRYLKQGNVALVRSALRERVRSVKNAPHLVRERPFVIPAYGVMDRAFYGVGLTLYDALAGKLSWGKSRVLGRAETMARLPTVEPAGWRGGGWHTCRWLAGWNAAGGQAMPRRLMRGSSSIIGAGRQQAALERMQARPDRAAAGTDAAAAASQE
jgi:glycerol-3-phosphate dehydrogenase